MDNFFIDTAPFSQKKKSAIADFVNRRLKYFKLQYRLQRLPNPFTEMNTIEVRMNYFHLLDSVIANGIDGDVVELGCFTGQCAMLFQKVIEMHKSKKELHLYDNFETKFNIKTSVEDQLKDNFRQAGLALPHIHKGYFEATIPQQLPDVISFVHIDCGYGGDPLVHKKIMLHCLESVYPKMNKGAVCILMDYHDKSDLNTGWDYNPGVKLACDEFFVAKPERILSLYGNQYAHGFFRKH